MDAKARKVLNFLTKNDGEQEVFDISIAVKLAEDAVQKALSDLSDEDLVSRRSVGGKEFWSIAKAPAVASAPKKKRGPAVAGPDDHFDEFIIEAAAPAPVATSPAPIAPAAPSEPEPVFEDFEPKPVFEDFEPTKKAKEKPVIEDMGFEPKQKKEKKTKEMPIIDDDFEPKPKKEKKPKKEDFALPDDLSDDPLERP
ncbi:MAG: hypothetical protein LBH93_06660, partial [Chitinispirillales bacterium]|nr:hypothetical protein [Chitinispirillales bacterium]